MHTSGTYLLQESSSYTETPIDSPSRTPPVTQTELQELDTRKIDSPYETATGTPILNLYAESESPERPRNSNNHASTYSVASSTSTVLWKDAMITVTSDYFIITDHIVTSGIPIAAHYTFTIARSVTVDHIITVTVTAEVEYPSVTEAHLKSLTKGIQPTAGSSHGDGVGNWTSSAVILPAHEKGPNL